MAKKDNNRLYYVFKVNEKNGDLKKLGSYTATSQKAAIEKATRQMRSKKGWFNAIPSLTIMNSRHKVK